MSTPASSQSNAGSELTVRKRSQITFAEAPPLEALATDTNWSTAGSSECNSVRATGPSPSLREAQEGKEKQSGRWPTRDRAAPHPPKKNPHRADTKPYLCTAPQRNRTQPSSLPSSILPFCCLPLLCFFLHYYVFLSSILVFLQKKNMKGKGKKEVGGRQEDVGRCGKGVPESAGEA